MRNHCLTHHSFSFSFLTEPDLELAFCNTNHYLYFPLAIVSSYQFIRVKRVGPSQVLIPDLGNKQYSPQFLNEKQTYLILKDCPFLACYCDINERKLDTDFFPRALSALNSLAIRLSLSFLMLVALASGETGHILFSVL